MNEAEQRGYEVEIAETEEALRAEVPVVCRIYCAKTWDKACNRAGVEVSSELRRLENVFYLEAIRRLASPTHQAEATPSTVNLNEGVLPPNLPPLDQSEPAKRSIAPPEASSNKTATASEVEVASKVLNRILPPRSCQLGELLRIKRKSPPRRQTNQPARPRRSNLN